METINTIDEKKAAGPSDRVKSSQVCDFRNAYLHFELDFIKLKTITVTVKQPFTLNHVRIPLECRCTVNGVEYVLGAACKTESVNVKRDIWTLPNADFNPVASKEHFMIIKQWDHCERHIPNSITGDNQPWRQSGLAAEAWPNHRIDTPMVDARQLNNAEEAWDAIVSNRPIVSRTSFRTDDGLDVVLEYPVKTVNVSNRDNFCQPDTGPVLIPLANEKAGMLIDRFHLAYIAQCGESWAEFIVNVPTPISPDRSVGHYSMPVRVSGENELFVLE